MSAPNDPEHSSPTEPRSRARFQQTHRAAVLRGASSTPNRETRARATKIRAIDFDDLAAARSRRRAKKRTCRHGSRRHLADGRCRRRQRVSWTSPGGPATGRGSSAAGEIALFLVAAEQGTRPRFDLPKGMFPVGPIRPADVVPKSFANRIARHRGRLRCDDFLVFDDQRKRPDAETSRVFRIQTINLGLPPTRWIIFSRAPSCGGFTNRQTVASPRSMRSPSAATVHAATAAGTRSHGWPHGLKDGGAPASVFYFSRQTRLVTLCESEFIGQSTTLLSRSE